jgi:hypothetical protein
MSLTIHTSLAAAACLSDRDLLDATARAAADERRATTDLIALLAEVDSRKLYLGEGYSSMFTYCRHRLRLSEFAAYGRITAARCSRRFPLVLARLAEGDVTLTSIGLLAPYLTDENHEALLDAAHHATRRDVELLVASLYGQPDIPASIRRLPASEETPIGAPAPLRQTLAGSAEPPVPAVMVVWPELSPAGTDAPPTPLIAGGSRSALSTSASFHPPAMPARRDAVAPLAVDRYLLRVTIGAATNARLDRARDLLRHVVPDGNLALILDRALAVLVDQLERRKTGRVLRSSVTRSGSAPLRAGRPGPQPRGRHIPAAVRREVWSRDGGRCRFVGPHGRCDETGFLEYHHVVPYAKGGATDAANLELRCRAHNAYEAAKEFAGTAQTQDG